MLSSAYTRCVSACTPLRVALSPSASPFPPRAHALAGTHHPRCRQGLDLPKPDPIPSHPEAIRIARKARPGPRPRNPFPFLKTETPKPPKAHLCHSQQTGSNTACPRAFGEQLHRAEHWNLLKNFVFPVNWREQKVMESNQKHIPRRQPGCQNGSSPQLQPHRRRRVRLTGRLGPRVRSGGRLCLPGRAPRGQVSAGTVQTAALPLDPAQGSGLDL